jgi:helicase required for RNAi-mediated heterochromatin assembly 1
MLTVPVTDEQLDVNLDERLSQQHSRLHRRDQQKGNKRMIKDDGLHTDAIRQYVEKSRAEVDSSSWVSCCEVPTSAEIFDIIESWQRLDPKDGSVVLQGNVLQGPWPSKNEYLMGHYELLREEAVRPLREAVHWVKNNPTCSEDQRGFGGNMGIYEKVSA